MIILISAHLSYNRPAAVPKSFYESNNPFNIV